MKIPASCTPNKITLELSERRNNMKIIKENSHIYIHIHEYIHTHIYDQ